jgi:hypothetical protein
VSSVSASGFRPRTLPRLTQADDRPPPPAPWSGEEQVACFVVRDRGGQALAYVLFRGLPGRRSVAKSAWRGIFRVRSRARRAHHARNPDFSFARRTGDRCSRVVALSLTEGISTSSGRLQLGDRDEARRIAANVATLPELVRKGHIDSTLRIILPTEARMLRERIRLGLGFIEPCLPSPANAPPCGSDWIHEIKHDGFRMMARRNAIATFAQSAKWRNNHGGECDRGGQRQYDHRSSGALQAARLYILYALLLLLAD